MIYRHRKHRKKWRERGKKKPERMLTPYRAKHGIGSLVKKIITKIKPKPKPKDKGLGSGIKPSEMHEIIPKNDRKLYLEVFNKRGKKAKGGRIGYQSGGRTRLLEELGRVEAEPSNRNRRAEISRVHRELNKGYKSGGAVLKGKKVGIQIK